jgi:hypothetical protein
MLDPLLTFNTQRAIDLAAHLKKQIVKVADLRVGDIIVDDHSVWHVAQREPAGDCWSILEEDANGGIYHADDDVIILDRAISKSNEG